MVSGYDKLWFCSIVIRSFSTIFAFDRHFRWISLFRFPIPKIILHVCELSTEIDTMYEHTDYIQLILIYSGVIAAIFHSIHVAIVPTIAVIAEIVMPFVVVVTMACRFL